MQATLHAALLESLENGSVTQTEFNRVCSALMNVPSQPINMTSRVTHCVEGESLTVAEFNDECQKVLADMQCKLVSLRGFSVTREDGTAAPIAALKKVDSLYRRSIEELRFNGFKAPAKAYLFVASDGSN